MRLINAAWMVLILLFAAVPAHAGAYEDAYAAYQRGDYAKAGELFMTAADEGSAAAMVFIGFMYERNLGFKKDLGEALYWYRKGAEAGNSMAKFNIGVFYRDGLGVKADQDEALRWFRQAADAGVPDAYYSLAQAYNNGSGVRSDYKVAADYMYRSLEKGYQFAVKEMTTNAKGWHVEFRRNLQRRLRDAGYYNGAIDGAFGPATSRAIKALAEQPKQPVEQPKQPVEQPKQPVEKPAQPSGPKGWLGVKIQDVGGSNVDGALVSEIVKNSPAEAGGIQKGDLIVEWDGKSVSSSTDLSSLVQATTVGRAVALKVLRNWQEKALAVTVGDLRDAEAATADQEQEEAASAQQEDEGQKPVPAAPGERMVVNIPQLNVFPRPDANAARIGMLFGGVEVNVKQRKGSGQGSWAEVCTEQICGWVGAEFLAAVSPAAGEGKSAGGMPGLDKEGAAATGKSGDGLESNAPAEPVEKKPETEGLGTLD